MRMRVTKTIGGEEWLLFDEEDIRKACALEGCNDDMREGCLENMREGGQDCTTCYITLINELKAVPSYARVRETI